MDRVGRNHHPPPGNLTSHQLLGQVFPLSDKLHLRGDLVGTGTFKLSHTLGHLFSPTISYGPGRRNRHWPARRFVTTLAQPPQKPAGGNPSERLEVFQHRHPLGL